MISSEPRATPPPTTDDGRGAPVVTVEHLVKRYGKGEQAVVAVKDVSFDVYPGEIFGFLGPNGAGKTTTISVLVHAAEADRRRGSRRGARRGTAVGRRAPFDRA